MVPLTYLSRKEPHRDKAGNIIGLIGISRDITERKEYEEKLIFKHHQLDTIFQQSPAAMALWVGHSFVFEKVNPKYQAIFPDRQLQGKPFLEACPEFNGQPFLPLLEEVLRTGVPFIGQEVLARHADYRGGPLIDHYYDFSYMRVNDAKGNPYGVYDHAIDVTDRVIDRKALEESKNKLLSLVHELELEKELRVRFIAMLTHDLRTPLTIAKLSAQMLERKNELSPDEKSFLHRISDSLSRMDQMIRDLLDANLIRAGEKLPIEIELCEMNLIVSKAIGDLTTVHGDRFRFSPKNPIEGYWSQNGIRRILENLCNNAVKYGHENAPIMIELNETNEHIELSVRNDGPPIPLADQLKLFEPFKRTESANTSKQKGWGLGLALVKGIAESHGGKISIQSSDVAGTTFTVTLPRDCRFTV